MFETPQPPITAGSRLLSRRQAAVYLFLWVLGVAYFGRDAWDFSHRLTGTFTGIPASEATEVREALVKNFSTAMAFPTAIVWEGKGLPAEERNAYWEKLLQTARESPGVDQIVDVRTMMPKPPREDWYCAFVALKAVDFGQAEVLLPPLRTLLRERAPPPPGAPDFSITGGPAMFRDLNVASTQALRDAELIALPLAFVILVIVFRTVVAALLPVIVAGVGVVVALGLLSLFAQYYPVTFFVPNLVTMVGLGVGIDYSLIFLARYRRERGLHLTTQEALIVTRQTAGHTVVASAVLVMTGFIALLVVPLQFFNSIAVGGMLVVGCVALSTFTLLPALILFFNHALEWGELYSPYGNLARRAREFNHRWARRLLAHPWKFFIFGTLVLLLIAFPVTQLRVTSLEVDTLPEGAEARTGYESMEGELGAGWLLPTVILVQHPDDMWFDNEGLMNAERSLVMKLLKLSNTSEVVAVSEPGLSGGDLATRLGMLEGTEDTTQSLLLLISRDDPQSPSSRQWLEQVDALLTAQELSHPEGDTYKLGGVAATTLITDDVIFAALPQVILVTLISTFILLMFYMKSVFVPLKAITLNLLCVLAAYGFQVMWFQEGWGAGLGAFEQTEGLNTIVLVILFCTLFGLSMDYEVFILSAVRESWLDNKNMRLAVEDGLQRTAGIITSAAVILVTVFLCFAFGSVIETQQLGTGLSFAVILDATLIRLVLVPSTMALMGDWNWWLPGQPFPTRGKNRKRARARLRARARARRLRKKRRLLSQA